MPLTQLPPEEVKLMRMFAALRREDFEELKRAAQVAKEAIDDPEEFRKRMRDNPIFATIYQNDRRTDELRAK